MKDSKNKIILVKKFGTKKRKNLFKEGALSLEFSHIMISNRRSCNKIEPKITSQIYNAKKLNELKNILTAIRGEDLRKKAMISHIERYL